MLTDWNRMLGRFQTKIEFNTGHFHKSLGITYYSWLLTVTMKMLMMMNNQFGSRSSVIIPLSPLAYACQMPYTVFLFFLFCASPGSGGWRKRFSIPWNDFPLIDLTINCPQVLCTTLCWGLWRQIRLTAFLSVFHTFALCLQGKESNSINYNYVVRDSV